MAPMLLTIETRLVVVQTPVVLCVQELPAESGAVLPVCTPPLDHLLFFNDVHLFRCKLVSLDGRGAACGPVPRLGSGHAVDECGSWIHGVLLIAAVVIAAAATLAEVGELLRSRCVDSRLGEHQARRGVCLRRRILIHFLLL